MATGKTRRLGGEAATPFKSALFRGGPWQMTFGERGALEGIVSDVRPGLAIEIGTAAGDTPACLAAHSGEVYAIDLRPLSAPVAENVRVHTGDTRRLLPELLDSLAVEGRNVDLVLVDGDHSTAEVRAGVECLVGSPALGRSLVVLHDTMNDGVRRGVEDARRAEAPGVAYMNLDLVPGFVTRGGKFAGEGWGGPGLVVVDRLSELWRERVVEDLHYDQHEVLRSAAGARPGATQLARRAKAAVGVRARTLGSLFRSRRGS